jgi:hypothetical protein
MYCRGWEWVELNCSPPIRPHALKTDITLISCFPARDTSILKIMLFDLSRSLMCYDTLLPIYTLKMEAVDFSESL